MLNPLTIDALIYGAIAHARSRALEEAAQIADEHASVEGIAQEIAARIRALKEKSDG